jgi:hypothetical protein
MSPRLQIMLHGSSSVVYRRGAVQSCTMRSCLRRAAEAGQDQDGFYLLDRPTVHVVPSASIQVKRHRSFVFFCFFLRGEIVCVKLLIDQQKACGSSSSMRGCHARPANPRQQHKSAGACCSEETEWQCSSDHSRESRSLAFNLHTSPHQITGLFVRSTCSSSGSIEQEKKKREAATTGNRSKRAREHQQQYRESHSQQKLKACTAGVRFC